MHDAFDAQRTAADSIENQMDSKSSDDPERPDASQFGRTEFQAMTKVKMLGELGGRGIERRQKSFCDIESRVGDIPTILVG